MRSKAAANFFSVSYAASTQKFIDVCRAEGATIEQWPHPLAGPDHGKLATCTACFGSRAASRIILVICGTHGVEGLAGSGCQLSLIEQAVRLEEPAAYLFVHMLNPWGAAWGRRQNEANIDLNRNFLSFDVAPLPVNTDYDALHDELMLYLAAEHPEAARAEHRVNEFIARRGYEAFVSALFQGQYTRPRGINFGGWAPCWSNRTLHSILDRYVAPGKSLLVVDIHSGFGSFGSGTVISTAPSESDELARLDRWLGSDYMCLSAGQHALPYKVSGDLGCGIRRALPSSEVTVIGLEFGTYEVKQLVDLQIEDCLRMNAPAVSASQAAELRKRLTHFFYPAQEDWFEKLVERTHELMLRLSSGFLESGRK